MFTKLHDIARRQENGWLRDIALGVGLALFLAVGASVLSGAEQRAAHAARPQTVEVQANDSDTAHANSVCVSAEDSLC
jgi:anti-sigma factor RsiW